jgi:succinate-acetate transporter protein
MAGRDQLDVEDEALESREFYPGPQAMKPASPSTLGLCGFAMSTFVLGLYQCGAG